jgi:DNA-binding transcriptional MerR regulator
MSDRYTIGQLARQVGVPTSTVRFYERRGLLSPEDRTRGNYRLYGEDALDRLRFVRSAQAAGFTLADIGAMLRFRDGDPAPCGEVQALITTRLSSVGAQINELQNVQKMLRRWLRVCRDAERTGRCGVLEGLAACGAKKRAKSSNCS